MADMVFHSGKIMDQNGKNLIGAHIVANTPNNRGTISDFEGNFQIHGNEGEKWTIGHLGKENRTITLKKKDAICNLYT